MSMYYIVIREKKESDMPAISEVVRNAYTSNVYYSWKNALFNEITFQIIILLSAFLFIIFGIPLIYCFISIPIVLISLYVFIYGSILMKTAQILYEKKPVKCWIAEAYEPLFSGKISKTCWYKVINEDECELESIPKDGCRRKIQKAVIGLFVLIISISLLCTFCKESSTQSCAPPQETIKLLILKAKEEQSGYYRSIC